MQRRQGKLSETVQKYPTSVMSDAQKRKTDIKTQRVLKAAAEPQLMLNWICILRSRDAENSLNINEMIILSLTEGAFLTATSDRLLVGGKVIIFFKKLQGQSALFLNVNYLLSRFKLLFINQVPSLFSSREKNYS